MRTTLNLDDDLLIEAKLLAVRTRRTLTAVIEEALRKSLAAPSPGAGTPGAYELPVSSARGGLLRDLPEWDGGGFPEGVDIDNNAALLG